MKVHRSQELVHPSATSATASVINTNYWPSEERICHMWQGLLGNWKQKQKLKEPIKQAQVLPALNYRGTEEYLVEWIISHQLSRCDCKLWFWDYWRCWPRKGEGAAHTVQSTVQRECAPGKGRRRFSTAAKRLGLSRNEPHIEPHILKDDFLITFYNKKIKIKTICTGKTAQLLKVKLIRWDWAP